MIFERSEEIGLSHFSYAIGCSDIGQVAIIDPRYDVDIYLDYAEKNRLVISHVLKPIFMPIIHRVHVPLLPAQKQSLPFQDMIRERNMR